MTGAGGGDADASADEGVVADGSPSWWTALTRRSTLLIAGLVAFAGGIPLAVALGVLHHPRWYPILDLAQTELRIRDVGTSHTPLVGLPGRVNGNDGLQGSHPGPLSFWVLAPFYTVFGRTAFAMEMAAAAINLLAMGVALWIANRRGGLYAVLGGAVILALLMRSYGGSWLTEAWNPYMPMMWWVVFLLAVWSVWCDDLVMLPVAVFAGTFCAQTHLPYVGLVFGIGGLTAVVLGWRHRGAIKEAASRRRVLLWGLPAVALLVLLWLPPVIDQVINERGNLTLIKENFTRTEVMGPDLQMVPVEHIGVATAVKTVITNLSLDHVLFSQTRAGGVPADSYFDPYTYLVLGAWAGAVVVAWRRRWSDLLNLHAVIGASLVLAVVAISRIFDLLWYYLVLWLWGTLALLLLATVWTYARAWRERLPGGQVPRWAPAVLAGALVGAMAWSTYDATSSEKHAAEESYSLGIVARQLLPQLEAGELPGGGKDGKYLVRWAWDPLSIGSQGFGLLLELDRQGYDVGVMQKMGTGAAHYRERQPEESTATINYVIGEADITTWRTIPGAVEAAYYEPRSDEQQERFAELRAETEDIMRDAGIDDPAAKLDGNLFATGIAPTTPKAASDNISEMMDLGLPIAIFVAPATSDCHVNVPEDHAITC